MVVIDTNILVYLLIAGDRTPKARALFARDADWRSDVFVLIEFCNVLVTYLRAGSLRLAQAEELLTEAEGRWTAGFSLHIGSRCAVSPEQLCRVSIRIGSIPRGSAQSRYQAHHGGRKAASRGTLAHSVARRSPWRRLTSKGGATGRGCLRGQHLRQTDASYSADPRLVLTFRLLGLVSARDLPVVPARKSLWDPLLQWLRHPARDAMRSLWSH